MLLRWRNKLNLRLLKISVVVSFALFGRQCGRRRNSVGFCPGTLELCGPRLTSLSEPHFPKCKVGLLVPTLELS